MASLPLRLAAFVCAGTCVALPAAAQSVDEWAAAARIREQRTLVLSAMARFTRAIDGTYGDESATIWSSLDSMAQALGRWDAALRDIEAVLAAGAQTPDTHVSLATLYIERGRVDDALDELADARLIAPERADVMMLQALLEAATNRPAAAFQSFAKAAALDPSDPSALYGMAQQLTKLGERQQAAVALRSFVKRYEPRVLGAAASTARAFPFVDLLQDAPSAEPVFAPALYAAGFRLLKRGDYREAIAEFRRAAARDPVSTMAAARSERAAPASASLRRGDLPAALADFEALVSQEPGNAEARRLLGVSYWADEQYDRSVAEFRAVLGLAPRDERAHVWLATALIAADRPDEAERALEDAIEAIPESGRAWYDMGRLYQSRGRHPEALRAFERAILLEPIVGVSTLHQIVGAAYFREGSLDRAVAAQARRIELNPNDALAHRALAELYLQQERVDDALAELIASLLINPKASDAFAMLAQMYQGAGSYAEAVDVSARALALDPDHAGARYTRATALMRLGRDADAREEFDVFARLQSVVLAQEHRQSSLTALVDEAAVRLESRDHDQAIRLLQTALAMAPETAVLHLQLGRALMAAGRYQDALPSLNDAARRGVADSYRLLADAYARLERIEESRQARAAHQSVKQERLRRLGERQ